MGEKVALVGVEQSEAGRKLVDFIKRRAGKDVPTSAVMRWIRTGQVRLDGRRAGPYDRVAGGQTVRIPPFRPGEKGTGEHGMAHGPDALPLPPVVFEGDGLMVLAKPAGLPVQPGTGHADSVQTRLAAAYSDAAFIPAPVHRLDKDTTGLLVVAATHHAARAASEAFRTAGVKKDYLAWVHGTWRLCALGETIPLCDRLAKTGPAGREKVHSGQAAGHEALALATPLVATPERSLVRLRLVTGKTHQLRVQLASRGHPILGDAKYGPPGQGHGGGLCLHCWRMALLGMSFELPPPWDGELAVPPEALTTLAKMTGDGGEIGDPDPTTKSGSRF
ncbi:MAG: RluA family pseudouridine synthase [Desulfovibrionaceae bacterium]|nr:RluA family pseudouridine synthase [Desulfovibrionaceae bacterium]